jgi:hypothetical protein
MEFSMAYVAISNELQTAVVHGIRAMAHRELTTIGAVPKLKGTEAFVTEALWGDYVALRQQMPPDWKRKADRILVRIQFGESVHQETMFMQAEQEAPPRYDPYNPPRVTVDQAHPDIAEIARVLSNVRDAKKRWQDVEQQVLQFLRQCKSLNEGLKLWPDLRMYIPKDYLQRIERKVERPKEGNAAALDTLKSINTDQIVAAAVIARMSTGGTNES